MSGLFGTLSVALSGLLAEQNALAVTTNNVSNANTPGFSRQRPVLMEGNPVVQGSLTFGTGVVLHNIESVRDSILELRLNDETQQRGQLDAMVSALKQVEVMFSGSGTDLGTQITNFFSSLQQLSTDPTSPSERQGVLTAGNNLALAFHSTVANLQEQRSNLDLSVGQTVDQINVLTSQIAHLNREIKAMENLHQDAGSFVDQRNEQIRQLSELVDVSVVQSDDGLTLTTSHGMALVTGQRSFDLQAQLDPAGVQHVYSLGSDITAKITAGKLGGLLDVRDQKLPALLADLDTLAAGLTNAINTAHRTGFDLAGIAGGDLLAPPPGGPGAAANFAVLITDPSQIAASSDGSVGSNGNLAKMIAVQNQGIAGAQTATDFYAGIVFRVGTDVANGTSEQDASDMILRQLEDQRGAISGVSMDEEAANLVRYQRAYEAAARVISAISEMTDVAVQLGRY
ncbi:MAG TPA: flagellar hook-associated protein FlgK [Terriglobales bacterium]|jgi:flagellar hook-associated protein 1 FlgK